MHCFAIIVIVYPIGSAFSEVLITPIRLVIKLLNFVALITIGGAK